MLSWQLYIQLFREMQNENAEYVCIDYDNKVQDDNDFEPETHCKNIQGFPTSCYFNLLFTIVITRKLIVLESFTSTKKGGSRNKAFCVLSVSGKHSFLVYYS